MIVIIKKIISAIVAAVLFPISALAYNIVDLPNSMTFSDALGIFDYNEVSSATVCDMESNTYKNLTESEIQEFYNVASDVTVWRKINPTPFRGASVNFTTISGEKISYYANSGIQIGVYGSDNYVCYMPAKDDAVKLSYIFSEFYDSEEGKYGGTMWNVVTSKDFLKLPQDPWAVPVVQEAARKSLVPYEFTNKYNNKITREELAVLISNLITVAGNYSSMDSFMKATGTVYLKDNFKDCVGRDEAIDQLFALGIISGRTGDTFVPDGAVSRQEAAAIMTRVANIFMYVGTDYQNKCSDKNSIASWADFYVKWILHKGIMSLDSNNRFNPNDSITVQESVAMMSRLYDLITYWEF